MAKVYVLTKAAQVNVIGGMSTLLLPPAILPENIDPAQLQHLLDIGHAVEGELVGGLEPVFTGDLQTQLTQRVADDAGDEPDDVGGDGPIPPKSADKATWVDFAVSKGATQADAEALTKDQLIEQYGTV